MLRDVVVTGYGLVSSLGHNAEEFERRMFNGESGVKPVNEAFPPGFPVPYLAYVDRRTLPPSELYKDHNQDSILKSWLMTAAAIEQTLKDVPRDTKWDALIYGTADGASFDLVLNVIQNGIPSDFDFHQTCSESSLTVAKAAIEKMGFNIIDDRNVISLNSACASGNQTIGVAYQGIRAGRFERCIVGGVDARCEPSNLLNFHMLGALTSDDIAPEKASRPFAKDRSGFVRGEGAAVLLLESREAAEKRGAKILGRVSGYGCTSDAYRLTDGREDGGSVIKAIELAIQTAGLGKDQIDYINAHGTSTPLNDKLETFAIKKVFGDRAYKIPVSSLKSQIGHATIASSALEAIACLLMLQKQKVAPTINYHQPDPECDLDYVPNSSRDMNLTHVLSNSFGFGGQNACVVFSKEGR